VLCAANSGLLYSTHQGRVMHRAEKCHNKTGRSEEEKKPQLPGKIKPVAGYSDRFERVPMEGSSVGREKGYIGLVERGRLLQSGSMGGGEVKECSALPREGGLRSA